MRHRLRLFNGDDVADQTAAADVVSVRLRDVTRALQDAARWNRSWLNDFADDEVRISSDLYEVLLAYSRLRPGA